MDDTQPVGNIKSQILSNTPIGIQSTLVNDPVALVNDPTALVGGQTTQIPILRVSASSNAPNGQINRRR